ncbi:cytoskeleton-associated protein 2-like [Chanos chanos]|uniref:Cytoskeleton-associated protein 2-like n=1 Tax=Chanos chanos TaxID=29144 RepID=A0A6J2WTJ6_CHACN|nr:cytoskeleton-associated protein 2-like [Chanos chanos]
MTVDEAPTLSASELRMQKLREYLAEKGRLKPPNPKPYLRDKIPTKRLAGTTSESHLPGKGKENCEPDSSALRKACVRKPLAERRKQLCVGMNIRESKAAGNTKFRGPLQHHSVSQDTKFDCSSSSSEKVRKPIQILPNTRVIVGDVSDIRNQTRKASLNTHIKAEEKPDTRTVAKASNPTPPTPLCSRTSALAGQTVPRPAKASCQLKLQAELKTPKTMAKPEVQRARTVPAPRAQKLTAAQEERQRKLQEWREAKGISYKRPPMPVRQRRRKTVALPVPYWASMEEEDEAHSLVCAVERSLADCVKLLQEGCPSEQVRDVLSRVPMAKGFSKYWICQAKLKELDGDLDVLPLFEEAVRVVREPVDELRSVVFEILKKKEKQGNAQEDDNDESQNGDGIQQQQRDLLSTPKPVRVLIQSSQGGSSVVKYKVTATPGGFRSQSKEAVRMDGQEVRFFTPVRRSVRIEKTALHYPTALQEHDLCVSSCCDLLSKGEDLEKECVSPSQNSPLYIYRENEALQDQVHLKLVFPEETNSL